MVNFSKNFFVLSLAILVLPLQSFADYRKARQLLDSKDYTGAASAFFQGYSSPKDEGERLKAEFGLAQSLQKAGFFYSASKFYSIIVRRGPKGNNPFFKSALEELGNINSAIAIGQSQIVQLFRTKIDPSSVPGPARGFFFYYQGIEAFSNKKFEIAKSYFQRVPSNSAYHMKALFHEAVVTNLIGEHERAVALFEKVLNASEPGEAGELVRESANLNIARIYYETKRFKEAFQYYAQIPRDSENWLQAYFEAAWAFFMLQAHNNVLGNIHTLHSPFFENRFFPESYILQAITFLRLCRYNEVKRSLLGFKDRYQPVFSDVREIMKTYQNNPRGMFRLIYDYRLGSLKKYENANAILDSVSRTDVFKEANNTIRFSDRELARLQQLKSRWGSSGLAQELETFLEQKKSVAIVDAGRRLIDKAQTSFTYLAELSNQTKFINLELLAGKVDQLRAKLGVEQGGKKVNFIGGLQPLNLTQDLEYWPFEGEYWEDELGGYVYNINAKCSEDKKESKK